MKLIIVESPNKIKKIKSYVGSDYEVAASVGHIRDLHFNVPAGTTVAAVTPAVAISIVTQAQAEAAQNVLATIGKYTIGRNEWGLYVTDGAVKAKFRPGTTEEQARATTAEQAAEMIKNYKAWKKKNAGRK